MRHCAKFYADRSNHYGNMAVFRFFKMAAVRHLGFLKVGNFNCPHSSVAQNASSCQILCKSVKALRRYGRFSIFQDGGRPPSWIFKTWKFSLPIPFGGQNAAPCQILCRLVKPMRKYGGFSIFKMAAFRHLEFLKFGNFNGPYTSEAQNASSC